MCFEQKNYAECQRLVLDQNSERSAFQRPRFSELQKNKIVLTIMCESNFALDQNLEGFYFSKTGGHSRDQPIECHDPDFVSISYLAS